MVRTPMYGKIQELRTKGYSKRRTARELNVEILQAELMKNAVVLHKKDIIS